MNNEDRELLEMAAKAYGIRHIHSIIREGLWFNDTNAENDTLWTPLTDDGDALRLAVKLGLQVIVDNEHNRTHVRRDVGAAHYEVYTGPHNQDTYAATRRAIVRAAAEIGKTLK